MISLQLLFTKKIQSNFIKKKDFYGKEHFKIIYKRNLNSFFFCLPKMIFYSILYIKKFILAWFKERIFNFILKFCKLSQFNKKKIQIYC